MRVCVARRWLRRSVFALAGPGLAGGCGSDHPDASPPGAEIVHWTRADASRPGVAQARQLGAASQHRRRVILGEHADEPVEVQVTFEAAALDLPEDGETHVRAVPVELRIDVLDNDGWAIDAACTGPHHPLPEDGYARTTMVVDCRATLSDAEGAKVIAVVQVYGDGTVAVTGDASVES